MNESKKNDNRSEIDDEIIPIEIPLEPIDIEIIKKSLRNNFLFKHDSDELLEAIANGFSMYEFNQGTYIYIQEEEGSFFYIIKIGVINGYVNNMLAHNLKAGKCFGEAALMTNCKRESTVKSKTNVLLYSISGFKFRNIKNEFNSLTLKKRLDFLGRVSIFKWLSNVELNNLALCLKEKYYDEKEVVFKEGSEGDCLYIIKEGAVNCIIKKGTFEESCIKTMKSEEFFGEISIILKSKRYLSVVTDKKCILYEISVKEFIEALGENFKEIILYSIFKSLLLQNKYLSGIFVESKLLNIYKCFKIVKYTKNEVVFPVNVDQNKKIVIVIQGFIKEVIILFS